MKNYVQDSYNLYIDGQWVPSSDGKTFNEYNPSNGELKLQKKMWTKPYKRLQKP